MVKVVWSRPSLTDLRDILEYAERQQSDYGIALSGRLLDAADLLATEPRIGWKVPEYDRDDIRELLVHPYRLIYQVEDCKSCNVLAVVHASRNLTDMNLPQTRF